MVTYAPTDVIKGEVSWKVGPKLVAKESDGRYVAWVSRPCGCPDCEPAEHWHFLGAHSDRESAIQQVNRY